MFTEIVQKVRNDHLARDAFLYVRMGRNAAEQRIEFGVELVAIGSQGGVGERRTAAPDCAGSLQQRAETRSKSNIAGVDGILGVADEMGETDLVVTPGPAQLRAEAIGDPEGGRTSPRNSATTSLPRLARMTKQQS
jgi:hypothetical protein